MAMDVPDVLLISCVGHCPQPHTLAIYYQPPHIIIMVLRRPTFQEMTPDSTHILRTVNTITPLHCSLYWMKRMCRHVIHISMYVVPFTCGNLHACYIQPSYIMDEWIHYASMITTQLCQSPMTLWPLEQLSYQLTTAVVYSITSLYVIIARP